MEVAANEGVFRYLGGRPAAERDARPVTSPNDPSRDYSWEVGAHPDVVERLWDQLGKNLPKTSRALVFGTPALVHPESGVVFAFALGTEYALRLPYRVWRDKRTAGLRTVAQWTGGGSTDIERECGKEWILGSYTADEISWCEEVFRDCGPSAG